MIKLNILTYQILLHFYKYDFKTSTYIIIALVRAKFIPFLVILTVSNSGKPLNRLSFQDLSYKRIDELPCYIKSLKILDLVHFLRTLLVRIVENNKIDDYLGQVRLSKR